MYVHCSLSAEMNVCTCKSTILFQSNSVIRLISPQQSPSNNVKPESDSMVTTPDAKPSENAEFLVKISAKMARNAAAVTTIVSPPKPSNRKRKFDPEEIALARNRSLTAGPRRLTIASGWIKKDLEKKRYVTRSVVKTRLSWPQTGGISFTPPPSPEL